MSADSAERKAGVVRRMARAVSNVPGAGLVFVPPRTARFAVGSWLRHHLPPPDPEVPNPKLTVGLTAQVALDEALLGWMKSPRRFPSDADYATVRKELHDARALYRKRGFIQEPASYHVEPAPLTAPTITRRGARGLAFERLSWPSAYVPHEREPGRERWIGYQPNQTASAVVLRGDPDRPWLLCVHGYGTGTAMTDFFAFRARRLHRELGLNLIMPVLPLHGTRKVSRLGGAELMSYQLQNFTLGTAQAIADIRSLIGWARSQGAERIGVYGMSLGAYIASLLVTLEPGLEMVIAGAPLCDIPDLFEHHSTASLRKKVDPDHILGAVGREVHTVISPLAAPPLVPEERRYVFAGLGDRMSTPRQAHRLWVHWGRPTVHWYEGSHLTFLWSPKVARFIDDALTESGFVSRPRTPRRATTGRPAVGTTAPGPRRSRS